MKFPVLVCILHLCFGNPADLGEHCNSNQDCVPNTACPDGGINQYTCICYSGYTDSNGIENDGGICFRELGTRCGGATDCIVLPELGNACVGGECACKSGWTDINAHTSGGLCDANHLGLRCINTSDCVPITDNSKCSDGVCVCEDEYTDTNGDTEGGACVLQQVIVTTSSPERNGVAYRQRAGAVGLLLCLTGGLSVSAFGIAFSDIVFK